MHAYTVLNVNVSSMKPQQCDTNMVLCFHFHSRKLLTIILENGHHDGVAVECYTSVTWHHTCVQKPSALKPENHWCYHGVAANTYTLWEYLTMKAKLCRNESIDSSKPDDVNRTAKQ